MAINMAVKKFSNFLNFFLSFRRAKPHPSTHVVEVFEHARTRPVHVSAILEDDVDEGEAEEGIAAHHLGMRYRQHGRGERLNKARLPCRLMYCT